MSLVGALADKHFLHRASLELTPLEDIEKLEALTVKVCQRLKTEQQMAFYCGTLEEIVAKVIPLILEEIGVLK